MRELIVAIQVKLEEKLIDVLDLMYIYIHKAGATLWFSGGNESLPMTPKNKKFMLYIYFNFLN